MSQTLKKIKSKWRFRGKTSTKTKTDELMKMLIKNGTNESNMDINESMDIRRIVFVSLNGLYQTWRKVPCHMLYTAIFILPLKRKWIKHPSKYENKLTPKIAKSKEFIEMIQWKDSQKLAFFMLDEYKLKHDSKTDNNLVSPFWRNLSFKLETLYDSVHNTTYQPLIFNADFWRNCNQYKYNTNTANEVLAELYFLTMKFQTMQEILHQSNPDALRCIAFYGQNNHFIRKSKMELIKKDEDDDEDDDEDEDDEEEGDWFVSTLYDPYDIDCDPYDA